MTMIELKMTNYLKRTSEGGRKVESDKILKEYENIFKKRKYKLLFEYCEEKRRLISRNESVSKIDELKKKYNNLLAENTSKMKDMNEKIILVVEDEFKRKMLR
jgi:hypothetical protein